MAPTDLENLLDMGFEKAKAELALKKSGNRRPTLSYPSKRRCFASANIGYS